jgi:hypothetical protein
MSVQDVDSDQQEQNYLFLYHDEIGKRSGDMAAQLLPVVKPDIDMKPVYDAQYFNIKQGMLVTTVELTMIGALLMTCFTNVEKGLAFALGGGMGVLYVKMLQQGVDSVGQQHGIIGNSTLRLGFITALSAAILTRYKDVVDSDHLLFIVGVVGFMMYRVAILSTFNSQTDDVASTPEDKKEGDE